MSETQAPASAPVCIYCDGRRPDPQMTLEHVWPQALGGAQAPAIFKSNAVCERCNTLAGLFVDGAFLKSWFISNEMGIAGRQYLDPSKPGPTALWYMGIEPGFPNQPGEICERWIGPAGEHVYHVHAEDDDRWHSFAGGDVIRRQKIDPGRAYVVLTSQVTYWVLTGLHSFIAWFDNARRFSATTVVGMPRVLADELVPEAEATSVEASELAWIRARAEGQQVMLQLPLQIDFSDRFLAKVSLGIGANLFGAAFAKSTYADDLRRILWSRKREDLVGVRVKGANFWQNQQPGAFPQLMGLAGAWTVMLFALPHAFAMHIFTPGGRGMSMAISDDAALWSGPEFDRYRSGAFFFAVPERAKFVGPVSLLDFVSHTLGHRSDPTISSIEALRNDPSKFLPPR